LRLGYAAQGRSWLLTHRLQRTAAHRNRHQVNDYLDLVKLAERVCLGTEPGAPAADELLPELVASVDQLQEAELLLRQYQVDLRQRPLVALNTGATNSRAKCWPVERFAALGDSLIEQCNAQIVLIGAPAERENAAQVLEQMRSREAVNLAGETTLAQLIGLLARCDLLVSNDTGPAHIAAALGRPTLTLFGPTNEWETAPTGARAALMRAEGIECARCMHRDCPIDHRCMTRLAVEAVADRALRLLRG
jgi:heptosyltransferase-2